jgi:hypothetical protein
MRITAETIQRELESFSLMSDVEFLQALHAAQYRFYETIRSSQVAIAASQRLLSKLRDADQGMRPSSSISGGET